jgi:polyhydroxyalkanoate synthase subunit PhaC
LTFVLTSGGHNAGVVSEPGHRNRHFRILHRFPEAHYIGPDQWLARAERRTGSWWLAWWDWLAVHSTGEIAPPAIGSARYRAIEERQVVTYSSIEAQADGDP